MIKHSQPSHRIHGTDDPIVSVGGMSFHGRMTLNDGSTEIRRAPIIVALHGGTYTSAYFGVPGYSLLDKAQALGISVVALDRPGYGSSTPLPDSESTIPRNAEVLSTAIGEIWKAHGADSPGVVLIGHSIGGAIATLIAASNPAWPLIGLAISGVGLQTAAGAKEQWHSMPPGSVNLPTPMKDQVMFGPLETLYEDMPAASHASNTTVPRAELIDIVDYWPNSVGSVAANVHVPVHYRQATDDHLWVVDAEQVAGFAKAFCKAPSVDASLWTGAGHCIDFHRNGAALQLQQLAFALLCGAAVKP